MKRHSSVLLSINKRLVIIDLISEIYLLTISNCSLP